MKKDNKLIYGVVAGAILLLTAVCVLGNPKRMYTVKQVSEDKERITKEIPFLELSREELDLYEILKQNAEIRGKMEEISCL